MKKSLLVFITTLFLASSSAFCQRTARGMGELTVFGQTSFSDGGAALEYGQYTLKGMWTVGVNGVLRRVNLTNSVTGDVIAPCQYLHSFAEGDYMYRIAGTRSRGFNFYGGGGVMLGIETIDPFNRKPNNGNIPYDKKTQFLYGLDARIELEWFVARRFALVLDGKLPVNFSSQITRLNYEVGLGLRFNL